LRALGLYSSVRGREPSIDIFVTGAAEDMAHSSLRFGIGRFTTEAEIDFVVDRIIKTVDRLREMRSVLTIHKVGF
jgi:cysteine sulfinate desulfinase/cysteine desulfurase-like protein